MTSKEIIDSLKEIFTTSQELAALHNPALEGDIQIVLAIIADKLRNLDPSGNYSHQIDYE